MTVYTEVALGFVVHASETVNCVAVFEETDLVCPAPCPLMIFKLFVPVHSLLTQLFVESVNVVAPPLDAVPPSVRVQESIERRPKTGASGAIVPSFLSQKIPPDGDEAAPVPRTDSAATTSKISRSFL